MPTFELVISLLFIACLLLLLANRIGLPYPALLAIAGAALALVPRVPTIVLDPDLALALFVAPVLLDAAYDSSLRDLRDNWQPVGNLAILAVAVTTGCVAVVARMLDPGMPWAVAIALGAIVSPPDAVAATAVLRRVAIPRRMQVVLEGESLLNDATALVIFRLAITASTAGGLSFMHAAPVFLLTSVGSVAAGVLFGWLFVRLTRQLEDIPVSVLLQFLATFALWLAADRLGLSGVIATVANALTVARLGASGTRPKLRIVSFTVWSIVVLVLNMLAFILIGLQLRAVLQRIDGHIAAFTGLAAAVCVTVVLVRLAWFQAIGGFIRWKNRVFGVHQRRRMPTPTVQSSLVMGWCGMRGIVTIAAALALPETTAAGHGFPERDLVLFTAFSVVLVTLVLQGLTLPALLRSVRLPTDEQRSRELRLARLATARAGLAALTGEGVEADALRREYERRAREADEAAETAQERRVALPHLLRRVVEAERAALMQLWTSEEIGDDAFRRIEQELDWSEVTVAARLETPWQAPEG